MRLLLFFIAIFIAGCSSIPTSRNPLAQWEPSPNHDVRKPIIIVLHYTQQESVAESLLTLSTANSQGPVSAHYLIGKDGRRYQLVADELRAWHAGGGSWGTITDLNSASIGIELDNDGQSDFAEAQIASLIELLEDLCARWDIPRSQVIGHSDLAPVRKVDPGARFPWKRLYEAGFGIWPAEDAPPPPPGFDPWRALAQVGYPLQDRAAAVRAFHLRFRGHDGDTLDAEDLRILHALTVPAGESSVP